MSALLQGLGGLAIAVTCFALGVLWERWGWNELIRQGKLPAPKGRS